MTEMNFQEAAKMIHQLKQRPNDEELLQLYGLYKQATMGNCKTARPGLFDPKARAKWDNWNARNGMTKQEAERQYIELVNQLIKKYGI